MPKRPGNIIGMVANIGIFPNREISDGSGDIHAVLVALILENTYADRG